MRQSEDFHNPTKLPPFLAKRLPLLPKRPLAPSILLADPREEEDSLPNRPFPLLPQFSDLRELQDWFAFAGQFFADFRSTASVVPSSPQLAREMVEPARRIGAKVVVEFGPGTGPMTKELLAILPPDGQLHCFEINPRFVDYLQRRYPDERLRVHCLGAQHAPEILEEVGETHADAVVSSLPLSFFPSALRTAILGAAARCLLPGGVFTQFQYASGLDCSGRFPKPYDLRPRLQEHFPAVSRRLVWRNFPPAWAYHCSLSEGLR